MTHQNREINTSCWSPDKDQNNNNKNNKNNNNNNNNNDNNNNNNTDVNNCNIYIVIISYKNNCALKRSYYNFLTLQPPFSLCVHSANKASHS